MDCPIYNEPVLPDENGKCSLCGGRIAEDGSCTTLLSVYEIFQRTVDILGDDGLADDYKIYDIRDNFNRLDHEEI